jgi:5-methylcytosine-specific restriction protein A
MMGLATLKSRIPMLGRQTIPSSPTVRVRGSGLQRERARLFRDNPLCSGPDSICERDGIVTAATERDHIVPLHLGGADSRENTAALCTHCHAIKSAREHLNRVTTK